MVPAEVDALDGIRVAQLCVEAGRLPDDELDFDGMGDLRCDLLRQSEHFGGGRRPLPGLDHVQRGHVEQRRVDPNVVAELVDPTLEHVAGRPCIVGPGHLIPGVDHGQLGECSEPMKDVGTDDVRRSRDLGIGAVVQHREYCDHGCLQCEVDGRCRRRGVGRKIGELEDVDRFGDVLEALRPEGPEAERRFVETAIDGAAHTDTPSRCDRLDARGDVERIAVVVAFGCGDLALVDSHPEPQTRLIVNVRVATLELGADRDRSAHRCSGVVEKCHEVVSDELDHLTGCGPDVLFDERARLCHPSGRSFRVVCDQKAVADDVGVERNNVPACLVHGVPSSRPPESTERADPPLTPDGSVHSPQEDHIRPLRVSGEPWHRRSRSRPRPGDENGSRGRRRR